MHTAVCLRIEECHKASQKKNKYISAFLGFYMQSIFVMTRTYILESHQNNNTEQYLFQCRI